MNHWGEWSWQQRMQKRRPLTPAEKEYVARVTKNKERISGRKRRQDERAQAKRIRILGHAAAVEMTRDEMLVGMRSLARATEWNRRRTKVVAQATPAWANKDAMQAVYMEAIVRQHDTGEKHEVDHVVPLCSEIVCGLNCEANLRVITQQYNRAKGNRWWPDMPELSG